MRKLGDDKKAQHTIGMPFGMIFAIFLIVVFVVIAFIAVNYFLDIGKCSGVGMFYDELQDKVDEAWTSQSSDFEFEVNLPTGVQKICFSDLNADITDISDEDYIQIKDYDVYEANTFLVPPGKSCNMQWKMINHINITEITSGKNPYCIDITKRNILRIKKDFYDRSVIIE